jgi:hypothetical protein
LFNVTDPNSGCAGTSTTLPNGQPAVDLSGLTADQEFEAGLVCDGIKAAPPTALPTPCPAAGLTSTLVKVPAPGTENDDKNPPRIQPRNLFDAAIGDDNIFNGESSLPARANTVTTPEPLLRVQSFSFRLLNYDEVNLRGG